MEPAFAFDSELFDSGILSGEEATRQLTDSDRRDQFSL